MGGDLRKVHDHGRDFLSFLDITWLLLLCKLFTLLILGSRDALTVGVMVVPKTRVSYWEIMKHDKSFDYALLSMFASMYDLCQ